ncbi:hypothetical protein Fot_13706 [Forsythia ovata]|uniref:Uncharacterized protein n=1 Tax=Forsythia ovata TaxID=205694 RepID=A0ABD1W6R0_9LAMI
MVEHLCSYLHKVVDHSSSYSQHSSPQKFKLLFTLDGGAFKLLFTTFKPPEVQAPIYSKKSWPQPIYFLNIRLCSHLITNNTLIHHNHQLRHRLCRRLEPNPHSLALLA